MKSFFGIIKEINNKNLIIRDLSNENKQTFFCPISSIKSNFKKKITIGSIVKAKQINLNKNNFFNPLLFRCELTKIFGFLTDTNIFPQLAIDEFDIDYNFSIDELNESKKLSSKLDNVARIDLQNLPIITIDGEDAKDFDDAVYAEKIDNKKWKIIISIADVSFFIKKNSLLDKKAKKRGNSVYFSNLVIPMFPEIISNDICSLRENKTRLCFSVEIIITNEGKKISQNFFKSIIKSKKSFTYGNVQNIINSNFETESSKEEKLVLCIKNLYSVYNILKKRSQLRGKLDLNLNEKKVLFNYKGEPIKLKKISTLESHKLIEELMTLANQCAAEEVEKLNLNNIYRIHEKPSPEKVNFLIKSLRKPTDKILKNNSLTPKILNLLMKQSEKNESHQLINQLVLRAQSQAKYSQINKGHFGLGLSNYVHFTSPIRRYSDLIIHRKLNQIIINNNLNENYTREDLIKICNHISFTERQAVIAERKTFDRLTAYIYSNKAKKNYISQVISIKKFGIFISFDDNLAEGLIHKKTLPRDNYIFNEQKELLRGKKNGLVFQLGMKLLVSLKNVDIFNGKLSFNFIKIL